MEHTWLILLRLAHVLGGIFWVGSALVLAWFLGPAQAAEPGSRVLERVLMERKLAICLGVAMLLTLASGFTLYGRMAMAGGDWTSSAPGMAFGLGGLAALLAALMGIAVGATSGRRMATLGREIQQGGPDPARVQELARLQARAGRIGRMASVLLLFAAAAMAVARYL
jgi:uncharacterized membrane protein